MVYVSNYFPILVYCSSVGYLLPHCVYAVMRIEFAVYVHTYIGQSEYAVPVDFESGSPFGN